MPKRKASAMSAPGEQTVTTPITPPSTDDTKAEVESTKQHREYLITNGVAAAELPPAKKRKKMKEDSSPTGEQQQHDGEEKNPAKTGKAAPKTPKNVGTKTRAATKKRKVDDAALQSPPKTTSDVSLDAKPADSDQPQAKRRRTPTTKAKANGDKPPAKRRKKSTGSPKADAEEKGTVPQVVVTPPAAVLSKTLQAKVTNILDFVKLHEPLKLRRDATSEHLCSVPEVNLIAALMILRGDSGLADSAYATVEDAGEIVIKRYRAAVCDVEDVAWLDLDFNKTCEFEMQLQERVIGHGLEGINLIEVELEMLAYERAKDEKLAGWRLYEQVAAVPEEQALSGAATVETSSVAEGEYTRDLTEKEMARIAGAVCPAPPIQV